MIPVLEVGGTHVSAALVDPVSWSVRAATRLELDADASAEALIGAFAAAAATVAAPDGAVWGCAMPDPFDYERGIGQFEGVGKFTSLRGVDVGAALRERLRAPVAFLNDADAFVLGEWAAGSLRAVARCAGITLGTGVGSGWLVDGVPVDPGVPPGGRIHRMSIDGRPLEDVVSRRAIRRAYAAAGGTAADEAGQADGVGASDGAGEADRAGASDGAGTADVREIAEAARAGDALSRRVLDGAMSALGRVVGQCVAAFGPHALVIGGSMSASWDLLEPAFRSGAGNGLPPISVAVDSDRAPLVGAAVHASRIL